jgi:peptidoglycan/xylan/chitin deacetylase (PgdA/CDA1 family)
VNRRPPHTAWIGLFLLAACAGARGVAPGRLTARVEGVATWRGAATAAYSIVHDDLCAEHVRGVFTHALPALERRGLRAGFGAIAGACQERQLWEPLRRLVAAGHDLFSHSFGHPCMTRDAALAESCDPAAPRSTDWATEIDRAAALLAREARVPSDFFIFPYDVCDPAALAHLRQRGYLGARCGERGINAASFADSFQMRFDVWGPAYSEYQADPACRGTKPYETPPAQASPACRAHVLDRLVDDAIAQGGWASREFHGFEGDPDTWEPISVADYTAHLDRLATKVKEGALWVDGPTPVLRYRWARERCALPAVAGDILKFPPPSPECTRHATVLTYLVTTSADLPSLKSRQAGTVRPARKLAPSRFAVDADPTRGDAVLTP